MFEVDKTEITSCSVKQLYSYRHVISRKEANSCLSDEMITLKEIRGIS